MDKTTDAKRTVAIVEEKLALLKQLEFSCWVNAQHYLSSGALPALIDEAVNRYLQAHGYPTGDGELNTVEFKVADCEWLVFQVLVGKPGLLRIKPKRTDEDRYAVSKSSYPELADMDVLLLPDPWDEQATEVEVDLRILLSPNTRQKLGGWKQNPLGRSLRYHSRADD